MIARFHLNIPKIPKIWSKLSRVVNRSIITQLTKFSTIFFEIIVFNIILNILQMTLFTCNTSYLTPINVHAQVSFDQIYAIISVDRLECLRHDYKTSQIYDNLNYIFMETCATFLAQHFKIGNSIGFHQKAII